MGFDFSWDDLVGHVTEFPSECLAYLIEQQGKGELFAEPLRLIECAASIISFAAGWVSRTANPDDVIGNGSPPCTDAELADAVEFCQASGVDVPAGGFVANLILTQLVSALIKQALMWVDDSGWPEEVADIARQLLNDIREAFAKRV